MTRGPFLQKTRTCVARTIIHNHILEIEAFEILENRLEMPPNGVGTVVIRRAYANRHFRRHSRRGLLIPLRCQCWHLAFKFVDYLLQEIGTTVQTEESLHAFPRQRANGRVDRSPNRV